MARNFIIFFNGKEGTTAIVQGLDERRGVAVLHNAQDNWEPFDEVCCGDMSMRTATSMLDTVYSGAPYDFDAMNTRYMKTGRFALQPYSPPDIFGLKMRFRPPSRWTRRLPPAQAVFRRKAISLMQKHNIFAFVAVRQDVLRWALSLYHGDGTGREGHLQFRLQRGKIDRKDIPKIKVDLDRFARIVGRCEKVLERKRRWIEMFKANGVQTAPMLYEYFNSDPAAFYTDFFGKIGVPEPEIDPAKKRRERVMKKVHSDDISDFVLNPDDVLARFGDLYARFA